ncbi:PREDICTED: E3 ubiquitin-protein ligase SHPRH-like [Priapulus caudatus]|uniref:E3 ubiquitin-protein ligase SHPRH-like n=1 Tax=Priapulus caudatus TaxID=37621 RepID=A0ABM1EXX8_PRICU|nr:PREDICTED: E3 ubiquitin-protein ligase SHPRH-like [Priapulus caudatus]
MFGLPTRATVRMVDVSAMLSVFMAVPSPLVAVQWWRVCLDEAQMVESVSSHTAQMALRLTAVNRWCVTGTPIERGLDDLQGLLMFLGTDPYWEKTWWQKQLYLPYCHGNSKPMISAISRVLWRTAKKDVETDGSMSTALRRPPRTCVVGMHQQREADESLTDTRVQKLFTVRWLEVRQRRTCCHRQTGVRVGCCYCRTTMTMEELLDNLIKKAVTESEESHRQLISALNGLAALHVIQGALEEAVDYYRQALASIARHSDELKTDSLQRLHTLHNLHETLSQRHLGVAPTLRDATLAEEANTLRTRYLESAAAAVVTARGELREALTNPADLARACGDGDAPWWASVIERVIEEEAEDDVIQRIQVDLDSISHQDSIVNKFRTLRGLEYIIFDHMCALRKSHDDLQGALARLDRPPTSGAICEAVECHLRPASGNVQLSCDFCKADKKFAVYEAWLFDFRDRRGKTAGEVADPATRGHGTWADSEVERCLKLLLLSQARHMSREDRRDADAHVSYMRDLKKEFRCLRAMWMALSHHVSAHDELDMATTRLRLRCTGEQPPEGAALPGHVIEPRELGDHRLRLQADRVAAAGELRRRLGQLVYLRNLERTGYGKNGGSNPDPCPTCYKPLGTEWSVLPCAHCYCEGCMRVLVEQHSFGGQRRSTRCPVCREPAEHSHISHVGVGRSHPSRYGGGEVIPIKGSHSTKVEAIVRCLMNIQREDASAKSLVFSAVSRCSCVTIAKRRVEHELDKPLRENNITHRMLHANNKFQRLNLIEATHVLLVEPILNPANQLQAIGRVHRIGQTKATFVHHFLIRNTIEERMYNMLQSVRAVPMSSDTDDNALTIGDLTSLFNDED